MPQCQPMCITSHHQPVTIDPEVLHEATLPEAHKNVSKKKKARMYVLELIRTAGGM